MKKWKLNKLFLLLASVLSLAANAQLTTSNLPIFIIDTKGKTIPNDPKITAGLKVIYNGEGKMNSVEDKTYHYDSEMGIELRGSSSQMFPKKPYGLELRNSKGEETAFGLCGLPAETDWILFASYNEKSLMHNVLSMSIARKLGSYSSRTKYVEVILNGSYQGVYVLMEKVKVDKNRVDIADLKAADQSGDQLTGGYIMKIDKNTGSSLGSFRSVYPNSNGKVSEYFYHAPKTITSTQKSYIKGFIEKWETAILTKDLKDTVAGYRKYTDVQSFVNMFLVNEVSRNVDGYRISSYFYKDKDSKGGKLFAGPPWDYDISYGNADYCEGNRFDLWAYRFNEICASDFWQVPSFWNRLVIDNHFIKTLRTTYLKERERGGILDIERLNKEIDDNTLELKDAQVRNFKQWNILGQYIWPNPRPIPSTYDGEIRELKNWLENRLIWLDRNMPVESVLLANEPEKENVTMTVFPNPFIDKIQIRISSEVAENAFLSIFNTSGQKISDQKVMLKKGETEIPFINNTTGVLYIKLKRENGEVLIDKALKLN